METIKRGKLMAGLLISLLFILAADIRVLADQEDKIFVIAAVDDSNEVMNSGIAVVIYSGGEGGEYSVLANQSIIDDNVAAYAIVNVADTDSVYRLEQVENVNEELGLAWFQFGDELPPRSSCVQAEKAVNGMTVNVGGIDDDGQLFSFRMRLTGMENSGNYTYLYGAVESGEDKTDINKMYPLPVISDDGNLVALMLESGEIISYQKLDEEEFQADADSEDSEETDPGQEEEGDAGRENGSEGRTGGEEEDPKNNDTLFAVVLAGGVILAVVIAAVVFGKYSGKKRKSMPQGTDAALRPGIAPIPPQPYTPVLPQSYVPPQPGTYPPTEPYIGWEPAQPTDMREVWHIMGIAGMMQGRSYPVGTEGLCIGRGVSSNIRYPDDVKGISRTHCRIFANGQKLFLMDSGSSYGTFLKGYGKLPAQKPVPVKRGDLFYLGSEKEGFAIQ